MNSLKVPKTLEKTNVRVLVCSANLGNAPPNVQSVEAWIPYDGNCNEAKPKGPVIMNPRLAKNPGDTSAPAGDAPSPEKNSDAQPSPEKNAKPSPDGKPNAESLFNESFEQLNVGEASFGASDNKPTLSRNETLSDDGNEGLIKPQSSGSSVEQQSYEDFLLTQQQQQNNNPENNSATLSQVFPSWEPSPTLGIRKSLSNGSSTENLEASKSVDSLPPEASKSMDSLPNPNEWDPPERKNQKQFPPRTSYQGPRSPRKPLSPRKAEVERFFDIIVIGLQEATFEVGKKKDTEEGAERSSTGSLSGDDLSVSDSDNEGVDVQEQVLEMTSNTTEVTIEEENEKTVITETKKTTKKKRQSSKNLTGKMLDAATLAGKVGVKVGVKVGKAAGRTSLKVGMGAGKATMKVSKTTLKTAKTAKRLTRTKDHTNRSKPSAQQIAAPLEDGVASWTDTITLHYLFEEHLPSYKRALSYQLGEMRLIIYCRDPAIQLEVLSCKTQPTGMGGLANKGGIAAEVSVNGTTRLGFLTAHLEAHEGEEKYFRRCESFREIFQGTLSTHTPCKYDTSLSSHFTFFMGDLNFRTRLKGVEPGSQKHIELCHQLAAEKNWVVLNRNDELAKALREKECLAGFRTPYCDFDPTFKVSRQIGYEYNPKRSPSFTDRILFKAADQLHAQLRPILYEGISDFTTSDHKPVRAAFDIKLNERIDAKLGSGKRKAPTRSRSDSSMAMTPEVLEIFVSAIHCHIETSAFDTFKKTDHEFPNPYLAFISCPPDAVKGDTAKNAGIRKNLFSSGSKWPRTSVAQGTFKTNWKDEEISFTVRTRRQDGSSIDLSGAMLYISLFDETWSDSRPLGSFPLNLARLMQVAREPPELEIETAQPEGNQPKPRDQPADRLPRRGSGANASSQPDRPAGRLPRRGSASGNATETKQPPGPNPGRSTAPRIPPSGRGRGGRATPTRSHSDRNLSDQGSGRQGMQGAGRGPVGWSFSMKRPSPNRPPTPQSILHPGPSRGLCNMMLKKQKNEEERKTMESKLKKLKAVTLRVDEPLIGCGIEVGRVTCLIDAWWTKDATPVSSWKRNGKK